ncbi:MAG: hypothetical protein IIA07_10860 [Proteobacteria bacterium]|nr:hypothetical protein [Pseudomonadota bacterium]
MSKDANKETGTWRIENTSPGMNVLMPDIYAKKYAVEEIELESVDESSPNINKSTGIDKSAGFNPYDTGTLRKK